MSRNVLFISGIDTNIGKSYATAWLKRHYDAQGLRTITQKMIQTGNKDRSEDIELHRQLLHEPWTDADEQGITAPIILTYPASPHLAARLDNRNIDLARLDEATKLLLTDYGYDLVLMEGAGGLMVPIKENYLTIDFIAERGYPVALVTSGRLGSINHTLLSLSACLTNGIELACVIYNKYPSTDAIIEEDTQAFLRNYLAKHFPAAEFFVMEPWE